MADRFPPGKFKRVPTQEECDPYDLVGIQKAKDQWDRDRAVEVEVLRLLRKRMVDCKRREDVNYPQRCREYILDYIEAFERYKSRGWHAYHNTNLAKRKEEGSQ